MFGDAELDRLVTRALADDPDSGSPDGPRLAADANLSRVDFSRNGGFAAVARSLSGASSGAVDGDPDPTPPATRASPRPAAASP